MPKPHAMAVTYLSGIADRLPPLHGFNCKCMGTDMLTKDTQRKEVTSESERERERERKKGGMK
jgi:hypothetical protein